MDSHTVLNLGVLLACGGVAGLYFEHWRRKAKRTELEARRVREELERKRRLRG